MENENRLELRQGVIIFIILAVLTAIEYVLGVMELPALFLWVIGVGKAAVVVWFFMHIRRVINPDEGGH